MTKSVESVETAGRVMSGDLSLGQERVWFLHELHQSKPVFTVAELVVITGELQLERLRDAFVDIADRHESLRCVFATADGHTKPRVVVLPTIEVAFDVSVDPGPPTGEQRRQAIQRWADVRTRQPSDVRRGPLWRVDILSFGPSEHALLLCAHQLIADRCSLQIMLGDLARTYSALVEGHHTELPPAPSYLAFAESQRRGLADPSFAATLDALLTRLAARPCS
ncbi:MAG: condensation domain-containing protein [Pseudonocardiaceae bacterium]